MEEEGRILNCSVCGRTVLVADPHLQTVKCLEHSPEYWDENAIAQIPDAPPQATSGEFVDETGTFFLAKYISLEDYPAWLAAQRKPNWDVRFYCIHHTWSPTPSQWYGYRSLIGVFNYYKGLGWTWGKGPQLFIGQKEHGSDEWGVWIATHPYYQGIGAYEWNYDTIHAEHVWNGDIEPFCPELMEAMRVACVETCAWAGGIPIQWPNRDSDGFANKSKDAIIFHRDTRKANKSCPGTKMTHEMVMTYIEEGGDMARLDDVYLLAAQGRVSDVAKSYRDEIMDVRLRQLLPGADINGLEIVINDIRAAMKIAVQREKEQLGIQNLQIPGVD